MIITKKALPRRTFLRGLGTTLALPLLDAMVPPMTALADTPANPVRRLGFVYIPMGAHMPQWTPAGSGSLGELSPSLSERIVMQFAAKEKPNTFRVILDRTGTPLTTSYRITREEYWKAVKACACR